MSEEEEILERLRLLRDLETTDKILERLGRVELLVDALGKSVSNIKTSLGFLQQDLTNSKRESQESAVIIEK